jgi:hydrogenase-4 component B
VTQLHGASIPFIASLIFSIFGLVLIGGLAILCFTKAFGTVFLGVPRNLLQHNPEEAGWGKLIPMYVVLILMVAIGVYPTCFISLLSAPLNLFSAGNSFAGTTFPISQAITMISICSVGFLVLSGLIFLIRRRGTIHKPQLINATWGCGYVAPNKRMQYTASSFIRTFRKTAKPLLSIHKKEKEIKKIFPVSANYETHSYDKTELWLIDYPLRHVKHFINHFAFFQNGNQQLYILYGIVYILLVLCIPVVYEKIVSFIYLLK